MVRPVLGRDLQRHLTKHLLFLASAALRGTAVIATTKAASTIILAHALGGGEIDIRMKNTHRGARTHDHKVKGLALCRLSCAGCYFTGFGFWWQPRFCQSECLCPQRDFIKGQQARVLPCLGPLVTVAILAQGTNWDVAFTQAFFENGQRQSVILHH